MLWPEQGLELAAAYAPVTAGDPRCFRLGAVGLRSDGVIVYARNGSGSSPTPSGHAEARLARKLDAGSTVYVARILADGTWAMAKPCPRCMPRLRAKRVKRVYYTIANNQFGGIII